MTHAFTIIKIGASFYEVTFKLVDSMRVALMILFSLNFFEDIGDTYTLVKQKFNQSRGGLLKD